MTWPTLFPHRMTRVQTKTNRASKLHFSKYRVALFEAFESRLLLAVDAAGALSSSVTQIVELNAGPGNFFAPGELIVASDDTLLFQTLDGDVTEIWSLDSDADAPQRILSTDARIRIEQTIGEGEDLVFLYNHRIVETDQPEFEYQDGLDVLKVYDVPARRATSLLNLATWSSDNALDNALRFIPLEEGTLLLHDHFDGGLKRTNIWFTDGEQIQRVGAESYAAIFQDAVDTVVPFGEGFVFDGATLTPDGDQQQGVWSLDADAKTTSLIRRFATPLAPFAQAPRAVREVTAFGEHVYFVTDDAESGFELWRTDTTSEGTELFVDLSEGGSSDPKQLTVAGNQLFFFADDGESGTQLWVSEGADGQAQIVSDTGSPIDVLAASPLGDQLIFFARRDDAVDLWISDGTPEGTLAFASRTGSMPFRPFVTELDGSLVFEFDDGEHGEELWVTDGTDEGTELAIDLLAGTDSSRPQKYLFRDNALVFMADDGDGFDIWGLELSGLVEELDLLPGDTNADDVVNFVDFLVVSENFGKQVEDGIAGGDFNDDGDVNFLDFLLMSKHFGQKKI